MKIYKTQELINEEIRRRLREEELDDSKNEELEDFNNGLRSLGNQDPDELRASFRRLRPDASENEIDTMTRGR